MSPPLNVEEIEKMKQQRSFTMPSVRRDTCNSHPNFSGFGPMEVDDLHGVLMYERESGATMLDLATSICLNIRSFTLIKS